MASGNALVTAGANLPAPIEVTPDQLDLIGRTLANGATKDELQLFIYDCVRRGVHPMDRKIHFTKRGGKYTPVTGIDYMRLRAAVSGDYAGNDDALFDGDPMVAGFKATVTVWRLDKTTQRRAYTATARWEEYYPENYTHMWDKMPHTMLAKCAEALALRKAFPEEVGGLYISEELDQAIAAGDPDVTVSKAAAGAKPVKTAAPSSHAGEPGEQSLVRGFVVGVLKRPLPKGDKHVFVINLVDESMDYETFSESIASKAKAAKGAGEEVTMLVEATKFKNQKGWPKFNIKEFNLAEAEAEPGANDGE